MNGISSFALANFSFLSLSLSLFPWVPPIYLTIEHVIHHTFALALADNICIAFNKVFIIYLLISILVITLFRVVDCTLFFSYIFVFFLFWLVYYIFFFTSFINKIRWTTKKKRMEKKMMQREKKNNRLKTIIIFAKVNATCYTSITFGIYAWIFIALCVWWWLNIECFLNVIFSLFKFVNFNEPHFTPYQSMVVWIRIAESLCWFVTVKCM